MITESPGKVSDPAEVLAANDLSCCHLDGDHVASGGFEHRVYLVPVAVAVVIEALS